MNDSAASTIRIVKCPHCRTAVRWEPASRYRPFCSSRCREIDLGQWASESYRITQDPQTRDDGDNTPFPPDA